MFGLNYSGRLIVECHATHNGEGEDWGFPTCQWFSHRPLSHYDEAPHLQPPLHELTSTALWAGASQRLHNFVFLKGPWGGGGEYRI